MTLAVERKRVGRRPFQVVELDLDLCRLTYATAPCTAALGVTGADRCYNTRATCQDPNNYDRIAAKSFSTAAHRITKASALTGVADSKSGIFLAAFKIDTDGTTRYLLHGQGSGKDLAIFIDTANKLRVLGENSSGVVVLDLTSSKSFTAASLWHFVMVSWDLNVGVAQMFDLDENMIATSGNVLTNTAINYTAMTAWAVGCDVGATLPLDGGMHLQFFAPGQYVDLSLPYNRRRVLSRFGSLVNLGTTGEKLTGTAPAIFLKGGATAFNTNNGTGGAFTAGTNADYGTLSPYLTGTKQTVRFCTNMGDLPKNLGAFPFLDGVRTTPARISPERGIGERASVTVQLGDAPHHDRGLDPYVSLRSYVPFTQGTFFTKLLARNLYYLGRTMRVLSGYLTTDGLYDAAKFETRTYLIDSIDGPDAKGNVQVVGKDALKLADDDKSTIPAPARGALSAAITSTATSLTLKPSGIGDLYYARKGYIRINREVMRFSRSGDTVTIVDTNYTTASTNGRGRFNTTAAAHAADDSVQECYSHAAVDGGTGEVGKNATDLIFDFLVTYAGIDPNLINKTAWDTEEANFMPSVFSGIITQPIGVQQAVNELCEVAGCTLWWDERVGLVQLRALRPISSASVELTDAASFVAGSVSVREDTDRRISQCVVYFGQYDPTEALEKRSNFRAISARVSSSESASKYNQSKLREIFSRWIPSTALATAQRVGDVFIERFGEVPKSISFALDAKDVGSTYLADLLVGKTRLITDAAGATEDLVFQAVSAEEQDAGHRYAYTALQERYTGNADDGERIVYILDGERSLNLRTEHDKQYAAPIGTEVVRGVIVSSATLGSNAAGVAALNIGDWPTGTKVILELQDGTTPGTLEARGGKGASILAQGPYVVELAAAGGTALYTRKAITLVYAKLFKIVAVNTTADTLEIGSHSYVADQAVKLLLGSGTAPGGLTGGTTYYIKSPTASTVQLAAAPAGAGIDITSAGSGVSYLHSLITAGSDTSYIVTSVDTTAETLTLGTHAFVADQRVRIHVSNGGAAAPPGGLTDGALYFVKSPTATTVQLALTAGGATIDLTSVGVGQFLLRAANDGGKLWGGGGGGGASFELTHGNDGGGGGGGYDGGPAGTGLPSDFTRDGFVGSRTGGGYSGGVGTGYGGFPGRAGSNGIDQGGGQPLAATGAHVGGAAGNAIDGVSYVTVSGNTGDRRGLTVN